MTSKTTLYLLASEEAFKIFAGKGPRALQEVVKAEASDYDDVLEEPSSEKTRGNTGQVSFNVGPDMGAFTDRQRQALADHAWQVLGDLWEGGGHDRIIIAAGPKMLGALRAREPKALGEFVAGELVKDLVNIPPQELPVHLGAEP